MIRITVELLSARTRTITHLGTATIHNDGTGTGTKGNYIAVFSQRGHPDKAWKGTHVKNFPRKRLLMWDLLHWALRQVCEGRE